jgi:hypothetical protein
LIWGVTLMGRPIWWRIRVWSAYAACTARARSWPTWTSLAISLLLGIDNREAIQSSRTSWLINATFNCENSQIIQKDIEQISGGLKPSENRCARLMRMSLENSCWAGKSLIIRYRNFLRHKQQVAWGVNWLS